MGRAGKGPAIRKGTEARGGERKEERGKEEGKETGIEERRETIKTETRIASLNLLVQ